MNYTQTFIAAAAMTTVIQGLSAATLQAGSAPKPRVIATTDGEVDDRSTMIRFLLYTCDFDVAGIVEVNSKYQKNGHSKEPWLENQLAAYEQVLPNLRKHNPDYPSTAHLRSVCRVGNENIKDLWVAPPDMETKNTPGEQLIIDTLLDNDPRPVHVISWGGANTTASALWKLKTEYPKEKFEYAVSRIRIYCIWYQDGGGGWIQTNIPGAYINEAYCWHDVWDYQSISPNPKGKPTANPPEIQAYMGTNWLTTNVKTGHGPLGALYPQNYVSEGDTPSFLHLINNGLDAWQDYTLGGWGGRSVHDNPAFPNHITDKNLTDDGDAQKMYWRWIQAAQNDFAARLNWCVAEDFKGANHQPVAKVEGRLLRDVKPGETVKLAATATDPDGNKLTFKWWQYGDADSAAATVTIANSESLDKASFVVPNEPGKQVHIILEVTDDGTPALVGYQRIICNIKQP
jgi:Cellulose-binding Sde182, nucleoside hydrolase-like domain/Cellulose-binding protein Sde0182, C-terminal domain